MTLLGVKVIEKVVKKLFLKGSILESDYVEFQKIIENIGNSQNAKRQVN
ncbi:hypothetical protein AAEX28_12365 [Lentisphaerota bacterium WC36G]|nr:hypothetical protein LJT99_15195 [Lentisphaerae bacterium WC36]